MFSTSIQNLRKGKKHFYGSGFFGWGSPHGVVIIIFHLSTGITSSPKSKEKYHLAVSGMKSLMSSFQASQDLSLLENWLTCSFCKLTVHKK